MAYGKHKGKGAASLSQTTRKVKNLKGSAEMSGGKKKKKKGY